MQNHARWSRRGKIQSESGGLCFLPLPPTDTKQSGKAGHGAGNRVEEATQKGREMIWRERGRRQRVS